MGNPIVFHIFDQVKSGLWTGGGRVPFGYDYDKGRGILVQNQDAEKVRQIYQLYIEGKNPIVFHIFDQALHLWALYVASRPSAIDIKLIFSYPFGNTIEGKSSQEIANILGLKYDRLVYQILTRKSNYGMIEYNGEEYKGQHEPII